MTASQYLKTSDKFDGNINKYNFLSCMRCVNIDMCNSVNQYFPNDQDTVLQNNAWIDEPFKVQTGLIKFNESK